MLGHSLAAPSSSMAEQLRTPVAGGSWERFETVGGEFSIQKRARAGKWVSRARNLSTQFSHRPVVGIDQQQKSASAQISILHCGTVKASLIAPLKPRCMKKTHPGSSLPCHLYIMRTRNGNTLLTSFWRWLYLRFKLVKSNIISRLVYIFRPSASVVSARSQHIFNPRWKVNS